MGTVTPLDTPLTEPRLRQVVSYEYSPMFSSARYNPDDLASRKGLGIYTQMMRDEQVKAVTYFKRDAVTSRGWQFVWDREVSIEDAEKDRRVMLLNTMIERMRGSFVDALNAIDTARAYGYSISEKVYDEISIDGRTYTSIHSILPRDPASFWIYTDAFGTLERIEQRVSGRITVIDPAAVIHYAHCPEFDRFYGKSDLREAYRSWYVKDQIIKLWALRLERFAGGFAVFQINDGESVAPDSDTYVQMQTALRSMKNMSGVISPGNVTFRLEQPASTDEFEKAIIFHDLAIAKSMLVPNLLGLSHAGQTGSYSQSQTQLEAFFWTLNADSRRLEAAINEQLFRDLCELNFGDGNYPSFRFKPASMEHTKWIINTWKDLTAAKAVTTSDEDEAVLRSMLDMPAKPDKEEDDDAAEPSDPTAAFTGVQITALQGLVTAVLKGELPKESAIVIVTEAFPISRITAEEIFKEVEEGALKPEPPPQLVPGADPNNPDDPNAPPEQGGAADGGNGPVPPPTPPSRPPAEVQNTVQRVEYMRRLVADVREGRLPKSLAFTLLTIPNVGLSAEDADRLLDSIPPAAEDARAKDGAIDNTRKPTGSTDNRNDSGGDASLPPPDARRRKIVPHTPDGTPRTSSLRAFSRAVQRVAFAVIERRSDKVAAEGVEAADLATARAVWRQISDYERLKRMLESDVSELDKLRLAGDDIGKIKAAFKEALSSGWTMGIETAQNEVDRARGETFARTTFDALRNRAAQYIEANGFRMAANVSDGVRAIMQAQMLAGIKAGVRVEGIIVAILENLLRKGFISRRAVNEVVAVDQLLRALDELFEVPATSSAVSYLETLVRTNVFEAMNEARFAEFTDPALGGFVQALEYSAIIDDVTTEICTELDGKVFATDSDEWETYRPPNHWNCRSVLIPITEIDEWDGQESRRPGVTPQDGFGSKTHELRDVQLKVSMPRGEQIISPTINVQPPNVNVQVGSPPEHATFITNESPQIHTPAPIVYAQPRVTVMPPEVNVESPEVHVTNEIDVPTPEVHVRNEVQSPEVNVEAPEVNITNDMRPPNVQVEAPHVSVYNDVPTPKVQVNVDAPKVEVPAPQVHVTNEYTPPEVNVTVPPADVKVRVENAPPEPLPQRKLVHTEAIRDAQFKVVRVVKRYDDGSEVVEEVVRDKHGRIKGTRKVE